MAYDNLSGVHVGIDDGGIKIPAAPTQPKVLILGTATSGLTYEPYTVTNVRAAESEFGANTEVMKAYHEVYAQGSQNIGIMRIGGYRGTVSVVGGSETLTITPDYRDDAILDRYALFLDGAGRTLVFDITGEEWVYDSDEDYCINTGIVEVSGDDLSASGYALNWTYFTSNTPSLATDLDSMVVGDFTPAATSVTAVDGDDGTSMTLMERYAALSTAYNFLDFEDADYVLPQGIHHDDPNFWESGAVAEPYFNRLITLGETRDELGFVWEYRYRGKVYTYFVESLDFFTNHGAAAASTIATLATYTGAMSFTADKLGTGGDDINVIVDGSTPASAGTVTTAWSESTGKLNITVYVDPAADTDVTTIGYLNGDTDASRWITAASTGAGLIDVAGPTTFALAGGAGENYVSHEELTGDTIPSAVSTKWAASISASSDTEIRETNFSHQLASFLHHASTTWSTMQGATTMLPPTGYSRSVVADWIGDAPTYTDKGREYAIDAVADNGNGVLGDKLMAGWAESSNGYRSHMITENGNTTDGFAYGGLILTKGTGLPNTDRVYGILDTDEALDGNNQPIDLGKYIYVTYDYPVHRNGYNAGTSYRGHMANSLIGKLVVHPVNEQPIAQGGLIKSVYTPPKIHASQLDALAGLRYIGLRTEPGIGYVLASAKTAANPTSDYTLSSTVRSMNVLLTGIRSIARPYLGKDYSAYRLSSLKSEIDEYLRFQQEKRLHGGARADLSYTIADKIAGRLNITLRVVPPFSIHTITVTLSLAADESEL